ncbi:dipeptidyl aminopeptidase/acylaminoacyl peptidase [Prosthecobacter fusiformis]|uniref:Dipeptidyl aminopeptidase/acylaminoacyl peptidase n=1 Tax=Prosthecobacter fusiformis TaxID=48464 RepID=A0A4R7S4C6_9BACT|nr:prolyl oligopeptidase family serine peptidase [Prosthecobacter fusiformis]TDU73272.1 dipeptidyl aminopeptidase/acylaminoacyl peptidase [Prosthecobacter fusiformis]
MKLPLFAALLLTSPLFATTVDEALEAGKKWTNKIFRNEVQALWLDEDHFWYRLQTGPKSHEYVVVNAATGERKSASNGRGIGQPEQETLKTSDSQENEQASTNGGSETGIVFHNQLREPVKMIWIDPDGKHHVYEEVGPGGKFHQNTYAGHVWLVRDLQDKPLAVVTARPFHLDVEIDAISPVFVGAESKPKNPRASPDGRWNVSVVDGRVMLKDLHSGKTVPVKTGLPGRRVNEGITWAPDSSAFVFSSTEQVVKRKITIVDSSPEDQLQPKRLEIDYPKAGDPLPKPQPVIVRLTDKEPEVQAAATALFKNPFIQKSHFDIRWAKDSGEFYLDYNERGHQCYRILGVNAMTGEVRIVVEETSDTFIDHTQKTWRHWLEKSGELLWLSERDGWCHLWLYEIASGKVRQQVTSGRWVLRKVEHVDEEKRQVWFLASGLREEEDPYHEHLCRVNLDGTDFIQLTEGDGQHRIQWSPNKKYFIDVWSRADHPPVTELRRSKDGQLICTLEKADARALLATGWQMPERFVAKGRDGRTDIHGIIIKPASFDPAKSYPVVEQVYAGPHGAFTPKEFGILKRQHELAELGFIVVQADGMGTNHRGKEFHELCWKNLKDAGFPDRIAWIRAAAETRPWMDLSSIGIYGGSAGGQSAMRALLDHHDFYKVAVADCGCHDNRMDKIWWNEQWMGWPVDDSYKLNSNAEDAAKLQGQLLLIVGELDVNVDPASTYQVVRALQKAGKSFDFMPIIGTGHGAAETPYGSRLRMEFLKRHLLP